MKIKLVLSFVMMISLPSFSYAKLKQNPRTGMYYSQGAKRNVNKQEYNELAQKYLNGNYRVSDIFAALNMIGTPAAVRLLEDYILLIQE